MIAPVLVTWLSRRRSGLDTPPSWKMRLPPPTTSGSIITIDEALAGRLITTGVDMFLTFYRQPTPADRIDAASRVNMPSRTPETKLSHPG